MEVDSCYLLNWALLCSQTRVITHRQREGDGFSHAFGKEFDIYILIQLREPC